MKKLKLKKTYILIAVYIVLIVTELFFYVPYNSIQIFRSNQNVPHTEIVGSGYATMDEIEQDEITSWRTNYVSRTGKIVNTSQLFMNVSITTIIFIAVYLLLLKIEKDELRKLHIGRLEREQLSLFDIDE